MPDELDELRELPQPPRGKIAPGSHIDTREQLRLYSEEVGVDVARRQVRLRREELARTRPPKPKR